MLNIVVLVSGGGTNLQSLIDAQADGRIPDGRIVAVVASKPDVYALERARLANIPAFVLPRKEYIDSQKYSEALDELISPFNPDLIVYAGFLVILSGEFCRKYEGKMLNIHPSLIPKHCGKGMYGIKVHQSVLAMGDTVTGATVHFVTGEVDGGPIVMQKQVDVLSGDTPESLQKRVMQQAEHEILPSAVAMFCSGKLKMHKGQTD